LRHQAIDDDKQFLHGLAALQPFAQFGELPGLQFAGPFCFQRGLCPLGCLFCNIPGLVQFSFTLFELGDIQRNAGAAAR